MRSSYSPFHLGLLPRRPPHRPCMLDEQLCSFQMKLTLQGVNEKKHFSNMNFMHKQIISNKQNLASDFFFMQVLSKEGIFVKKI